MEKGFINMQMVILSNEEATEVAQPGEGAFDFPTFAIAAQFPAVVERGLAPPFAVRRDQQNAAFAQTPAQRIAVVTAIGNDPQRAVAWSAALLGHGNPLQRAFGQSYFRRAGRGQLASQRNTRAVDHHHPLGALAALGFADAEAPFFAGAKLASRKLSSQSNVPRASSSDKNTRHTLSQTPCFSHRPKRRQQVAALGYSLGRSRQRAPVLSTHKIPSSTRRLSAHGRPRLLSRGSNGAIFSHCASVKNAFCIPNSSQIHHNRTSQKYLRRNTYETASNLFKINQGLGFFDTLNRFSCPVNCDMEVPGKRIMRGA